jgi:hypothetical protein
MIELTQAEAEKRANKTQITPLTEQEEFDVVMFERELRPNALFDVDDTTLNKLLTP